MSLDFHYIRTLTLEQSILIVDDDTVQVEQLLKILKSLFKEVYTASNGEDALAIYFDKHPSIVISDINMPRVNGIKLIEQIHNNDLYLPIFILSADREQQKFIDAMYAGAKVFLSKPLNLQELYKHFYLQLSCLQNVKKLKQKDHFYTTMFEHSQKGIVILDASNGNFFDFNTYAHKMLGYTAEEYTSLRLKDIEMDESSEEIDAHKEKIQQEGHSIFERRHRCKDGSIINVSVMAVYLEIDGSPFYFITFTDITKRVATENALLKALEDSKQLNSTKDIFLASMSHEIRTPLNGIIGIIDLLSHTQLNEEQQKYINTIKSSSHILKHLINDILDYSKLKSGKIDLEKIVFTPSDVINTVIQLFHFEAKTKGIDLILDSNFEPTMHVYGDSNRYTQILNNIIGNAIKFTHEGYVKIKTKCTKIEGKNILTIQIIDTGIGITREQLSRLFNPFEQASLSHTRKYGGTGLGLSISKQFAEMMDGTIDIESDYGIGSCFTLTIPFETSAQSLASEAQLKNPLSVDYNKKYTVLVVDDSQTNLMVISGYLSHLGLESVSAENGLEAIEKVKERSFDLILMDIHMPVMNGLEASVEIKKIAPSIPIVALSAAATTEEKKSALAIGINDYITKPIDTDKLIATLTRYLTVSQSPTEIASPKPNAIYGVNTEDLLKKLRKQEYLEKFFTLFVKEACDILERIPNLELSSQELRDCIHKIKGSSGNGSMERLFTLALEFESAESHKQKEDSLTLFMDELAMIVNSIREQERERDKAC